MKYLNKNLLSPKIRFNGFNENWESKRIEELLNYERPDKYIDNNISVKNNFKKSVPILTANKSFILGYSDDLNNIYDKENSIIFDDFTNDYKYVNFPFKLKSSAIKILTSNKDNLLFIFNLFKKTNFPNNGHMRHYISIVQKINCKITILEEQNKIAKFFELIDRKIKLLDKEKELFKEKKKYYLNNMFI